MAGTREAALEAVMLSDGRLAVGERPGGAEVFRVLPPGSRDR